MLQKERITIFDNQNRIKTLLRELVLNPRINALKWSKITKQTPNMKIGYPGQHLASLITGIEGSRTGARGDDLKDGSEVKSCSRVDQLDTCSDCKEKVLRTENVCPVCNSKKIRRMEDSKWLFSIKSEQELKLLTESIDRIFLTIADYPFFERGDFETIQFQAFEIWNDDKRHQHFRTIMSNYFYKIFLKHIEINPNKTPAPKNFWPYSYQFYLCNPVKVFSCLIKKSNIDPEIFIEKLVAPDFDRRLLVSEKMPTSLLSLEELGFLLRKVPKYRIKGQIKKGYTFSDLKEVCAENKVRREKLCEIFPFIDEETRGFLELRDTDRIAEARQIYSRRK